MEIFRKWWVRLTAVLGTAALTVFIPAMAWASSGPGALVVEAARGRRARGSFGIWGLVCCLIVVGLIVVALVFLMRNRRSGGKR